MKSMNKAMEYSPEVDWLYYSFRAGIEIGLDEYENAMLDMDSAFAVIAPSAPDSDIVYLSVRRSVWLTRYWSKFSEARLDSGIKDLSRCLKLKPYDIESLYTRGALLMRAKKHDFALSDFQVIDSLKNVQNRRDSLFISEVYANAARCYYVIAVQLISNGEKAKGKYINNKSKSYVDSSFSYFRGNPRARVVDNLSQDLNRGLISFRSSASHPIVSYDNLMKDNE